MAKKIQQSAGALVLAFLLATTTAFAVTTIPLGGPGNIPFGSTPVQAINVLESFWDAGPDYACNPVHNTLVVTVKDTSPTAQACAGRGVTVTFRLIGSTATQVDHPFQYRVTCDTSVLGTPKIIHWIAFDEDANDDEFTPINSGIFTFTLDGITGPSLLGGGGTDVVELRTTEGQMAKPPGPPADPNSAEDIARIPALGEWGGPIVALAIVALGAFLILRRRHGSDPASS